ncbi:MAG: DUF937 domain-containing protein [Xanthomonadales bacterium]|nr:DUF937 domain-containing protein [Xanthomonadales bacterium]MCP5473513.1 DUF937 domain-containing protein [Rhodanobacteraceae bacterium]
MSALDAMLSQLNPQTIQQMAGQLGASPEQTQSAIQAALPMLMGAMQRNAASPDGAQALFGAVKRDHQGVDLGGLLGGLLGGGGGTNAGGGMGGLLGAVMGMMGGGQQAQAAPQRSPLENGVAILGHVFGQQQPRAAAGVAKASGLDMGSAAQLLAMLAPMLMGALGQQTQAKGLDAGGLAGMLGNDVERATGGNAGGLQSMLGSMLDTDGDGDVDAADLLKHGSGLLSSFMRR